MKPWPKRSKDGELLALNQWSKYRQQLRNRLDSVCLPALLHLLLLPSIQLSVFESTCLAMEMLSNRMLRSVLPIRPKLLIDDCRLWESKWSWIVWLDFNQFLKNKLKFPNVFSSSNSIEKPALNRSISVGIPPTKPHLIHALRNAQEIAAAENQI